MIADGIRKRCSILTFARKSAPTSKPTPTTPRLMIALKSIILPLSAPSMQHIVPDTSEEIYPVLYGTCTVCHQHRIPQSV